MTIASAEAQSAGPPASNHVEVLGDFPVVEFRRYTIKPGERVHFAQYFESYFPESFQQLGSIAAGEFLERGHANGFTWIRGYHTIEARGVINAAFYYGPVWREHRTTLNNLIDDSDNVLLLRALTPERSVSVLPAVDPLTEPNGARGIVVAQVFQLDSGAVDAFARLVEPAFARYRGAGAREAGVLVTLDVPNNFPQLPVRTDGPYLVWLGILPDSAALERLTSVVEQSLAPLTASGMMKTAP
ncbi:MAG: NIPSNAP family protein, partial [Gemmatimonadota bacterium]